MDKPIEETKRMLSGTPKETYAYHEDTKIDDSDSGVDYGSPFYEDSWSKKDILRRQATSQHEEARLQARLFAEESNNRDKRLDAILDIMGQFRDTVNKMQDGYCRSRVKVDFLAAYWKLSSIS